MAKRVTPWINPVEFSSEKWLAEPCIISTAPWMGPQSQQVVDMDFVPRTCCFMYISCYVCITSGLEAAIGEQGRLGTSIGERNAVPAVPKIFEICWNLWRPRFIWYSWVLERCSARCSQHASLVGPENVAVQSLGCDGHPSKAWDSETSLSYYDGYTNPYSCGYGHPFLMDIEWI